MKEKEEEEEEKDLEKAKEFDLFLPILGEYENTWQFQQFVEVMSAELLFAVQSGPVRNELQTLCCLALQDQTDTACQNLIHFVKHSLRAGPTIEVKLS